MIRLPGALAAWDSPAFAAALCAELARLDGAELPLQQGLEHGSVALAGGHSARLIAAHAEPAVIRARVGIFFRSMVAGCSCADDPTPIDALNEYCEVDVEIDRRSAVARIRLRSG